MSITSSADRRQRHQRGRPGDAGRDRAPSDLARAVRARRQPCVPLPALFLDHSGRFDQAKLAAYLRTHTLQTVVGPIAFGPNGEWRAPRVLETQFRGVTGHGTAQFTNPKPEVILWPPAYRNGTPRTPYEAAAKP